MGIFSFFRMLAAVLICCALSDPVRAQPSLGNGSPGIFDRASGVDDNVSAGNANGRSLGPLAGGGGMADFTTLINLIQQTIDPDNWLANGGTSAMLEYPAGVYIDPLGHMRRFREIEARTPDLLMPPESVLRHPWRTKSALRTISLKRLDQALLELQSTGLSFSEELRNLAGLSRIDYVKIDAANEDILLAGPAGDRALGFQLCDLALVTSLIHSATQPIGCSIEPSDAGILAAQRMLKDPEAVRRLGRNPKLVVEQMQEKIGAHQVRVFGMNANSGTAVALIDADEHMKRVGFGTVALRIPIDSYFEHLERQPKIPSQSLIRWWFAYADESIRSNAQGDMFQLPQQCVAVVSEQQWVSRLGRTATGDLDPAADAFAKDFTEHLSDLRTYHPSYSRLCAVFDSALALQLGLESTGQPSFAAWFPNLCQLGQAHNANVEQPRTVEGLTTWHRLKNGTIVAVVSGGVQIETRTLAAREKWHDSKFLVRSIIAEQPSIPSSAHGTWWWD